MHLNGSGSDSPPLFQVDWNAQGLHAVASMQSQRSSRNQRITALSSFPYCRLSRGNRAIYFASPSNGPAGTSILSAWSVALSLNVRIAEYKFPVSGAPSSVGLPSPLTWEANQLTYKPSENAKE